LLIAPFRALFFRPCSTFNNHPLNIYARKIQTFFSGRAPTVWCIIPTLGFLIKRWETMSIQSKLAEIKPALTEGVTSLKKSFHHVDTTAYFVCLGTSECSIQSLFLTCCRS
jgi:hypothetical protein